MLSAAAPLLHAKAPCSRPRASRPAPCRASSDKTTASAPAKPAWTDAATVAGGGYKGECDIAAVKDLVQECATLDGERQAACWASSGCDIDVVTQHYTKAAGLGAPQKEKKQ